MTTEHPAMDNRQCSAQRWRQNRTSLPMLKTAAAMVNPVALAETAGNLITQVPAFAGYLGAGGAYAVAGRLGQDQDPKAVASAVADALTYKPRTDAGQHLTGTILTPLTLLNQALSGRPQGSGCHDSPMAGALTEATGQMLPAFIAPAISGVESVRNRITRQAADVAPRIDPVITDQPPRQDVPLASLQLMTRPPRPPISFPHLTSTRRFRRRV